MREPELQHVIDADGTLVIHLDVVEVVKLVLAIVDYANPGREPGKPGFQPYSATEFALAFQQRDDVVAVSQNARGLHTRRAGSLLYQ